jgi:uncharacterized protein YjbJ (UPF0337 family)
VQPSPQTDRQTDLLHDCSEIFTNTFLQEMNMKLTNMKLTGLFAAIVLTFCSFGVYAEESKEATPPMNKDQVEGRVGEAEGKVKEATGVILDDKKMKEEGKVQKNVGKIQKGYGDIKKDIEEGN